MKRDFIIALGMCLTLLVGFFTSTTNAELDVHNVKIVTVKSGDTLWDIASANSTNDIDVREMIHAMKELNQLDESVTLEPGSTLKIPTIQTNDGQASHYVATKE
ncbi:LysM peptidoglycan-binding domain-containing protein [uncultured Veillonella sp.]|uniref:LysM peptidoglycan-binding domain-containing protein n=1 Tax=uncultured Veillonella sp. TaxID=159268 RepID=UPI0026323C74|nr:LysM peptidoglycan-binding domain-containing protein [uncultured Veillonella sp.]